MKDRKEKAKEEPKASVANQLKFGAVITKFEPPKESKGGWGWASINEKNVYFFNQITSL